MDGNTNRPRIGLSTRFYTVVQAVSTIIAVVDLTRGLIRSILSLRDSAQRPHQKTKTEEGNDG
jgi:hypothetical protein